MFREDGFSAQKEPFVQFFSPDWEPSPQPSNYHFATNLQQFDNISSPQKERIRNVLSYAFPCAWPLKRLGENNMGKGFIDKAEENRWHPLDMFLRSLDNSHAEHIKRGLNPLWNSALFRSG